jgi:hypothetical protein
MTDMLFTVSLTEQNSGNFRMAISLLRRFLIQLMAYHQRNTRGTVAPITAQRFRKGQNNHQLAIELLMRLDMYRRAH